MEQLSLQQERETLLKHLNWLGIKSTGSERIKARIKEIDKLLRTKESVGHDEPRRTI